MNITAREKILLILVFFDHIKKVIKLLFTMEDLTLSVNHIFL